MESTRVLVIGPDDGTARALADAVVAAGYVVAGPFGDVAAARTQLVGAGVVLADGAALGPAASAEILDAAARTLGGIPVVLADRDAAPEHVSGLVRQGAFAVTALPVQAASLAVTLGQAARQRDLQLRNAELEKTLAMNERLAMIGKLAAGVAHELNNPLDGVLRYVNFAIRKLPEDAEQVTYLLQARQGLRRMADIVRDLLQFSRNANVDASDEDAERIARDAVEQVVQAAAPRVVTTSYEFPQGGCHVPRAVFQVIGNLAKNAVDAMPQGGRLRITGTVRSGRLRIAVADDGVGIPEEIRDRIFEPFFTTKEVGKGTGLGLSISQRIVERLGGTLELESEVGRGTTVTLDLPLRTARGASAVLPTAAHTARPAGVRTGAPSSVREGVF